MPSSYNSATVELAMTLSPLAYLGREQDRHQQQMISEINCGLEQAGYKSWLAPTGRRKAGRTRLSSATRRCLAAS
jgi:hypothetical protein